MKPEELAAVGDTLQYHRDLNPQVWQGWNMNPVVRQHLLAVADLFVEYLEIPDFKLLDIYLTGSLANFNYTRYSDFDLHIVTDYSDLKCDDVAEALYTAKKRIWNDQHDITIYGYDVELYVEDIQHQAHSAGIFSVQNNRWKTKPDFMPPHYDQVSVRKKTQGMIDLLSKTIRRSTVPGDFKQAAAQLYRMRQSGLDAGGEFSTENLAFKAIRNMGWIDRLRKAEADLIDRQLSLKK
jgi:hypothetical protein